jgi:hypothetical protein
MKFRLKDVLQHLFYGRWVSQSSYSAFVMILRGFILEEESDSGLVNIKSREVKFR